MKANQKPNWIAHGRLAPSRYLEVIREAARELAVTAQRGLLALVPRYPEWTVADLLVHTGLIHRWVEQIVRERLQEPLGQGVAPQSRDNPAALLSWFRDGAQRLSLTLGSADPAEPVWAFAGDRNVGFWLRRMAHETVTHRWDAESAFAANAGAGPAPFEPDVAYSGLHESLELHLPKDDDGIGGRGGRVALVCAERSEVRLLLTIEPSCVSASVPLEGQSADATVQGSLSDLWLLLTGRDFWSVFDVDGNREVFQRLRSAIARAPCPKRP